MKRRICAAWIAALCGLAALTGCATLDRGGQSAVLRAKRRVAPAIVHVRPVKEVFDAGRRKEMLVMGSGFIISRDGYVVTNEHVAGQSTSVQCVLSDNREVQARVVGTDVETDIAVLKLEADGPLPSVRMAPLATSTSPTRAPCAASARKPELLVTAVAIVVPSGDHEGAP